MSPHCRREREREKKKKEIDIRRDGGCGLGGGVHVHGHSRTAREYRARRRRSNGLAACFVAAATGYVTVTPWGIIDAKCVVKSGDRQREKKIQLHPAPLSCTTLIVDTVLLPAVSHTHTFKGQ